MGKAWASLVAQNPNWGSISHVVYSKAHSPTTLTILTLCFVHRLPIFHLQTKSHDFMFEKKGQLDPKPEAQGMDVVQGISQEVIPKSGCLFHDHVQGYLELNTSQAFQRLGKDLAPLSRSLPEVIHHLPGIVRILTDRLRHTWGPAHEHALFLVAVLAKEVGAELYAGGHFDSLMDTLLVTLDPSNPENTARVVQSMAHLFTSLHRPILRDLNVLKRYYGPLLGHRKVFVRKYAAEALAGLLRRLEDERLCKHLKGVVKAATTAMASQGSLRQEERRGASRKPKDSGLIKNGAERRGADLMDGMALLIFYITRGVQSQGQLHSKAVPVVRALLQQEAHGEDDVLGQVHRKVVEGVLVYLTPHLKPAQTAPLWKEALDALAAAPREESGDRNGLERTLHVLVVLLRYRKGWLLSDREVRQAFLGALNEAVVEHTTPPEAFAFAREATKAELVLLISALWDWLDMRRQGSHHAPTAEETATEEALVEATTALLGPESSGDPAVVGELASKVLRLGGCMDDPDSQTLVVNACLARAVMPTCPLASWVGLLNNLVGEKPDILRRGDPTRVADLGRDLIGRIEKKNESEDTSLSEQMFALRCLPSVLRAAGRGRSPSDLSLRAHALGAVETLVNDPQAEEILASQAAMALIELWEADRDSSGAQEMSSATEKVAGGKEKSPRKPHPLPGTQPSAERQGLAASMWKQLQASPSLLGTIRALTALLASDDSLLPALPLEEALLLLSSNLHSPSHLLRLSTLRLMVLMPQLSFREAGAKKGDANTRSNTNNEESSFVGPCRALATCLELEAASVSISAERTFGVLLNRIEVWANSGRLPGPYIGPLASHCLGLLHVRFAELWQLTARTFAALSSACRRAEETHAIWGHVVATMAEVDSRLVAMKGKESTGNSGEEGAEGNENDQEGKRGMDLLLRRLGGNLWAVSNLPPSEEIRTASFLLGDGTLGSSGEDIGGGQASKLGSTDPLTSLSWVFDFITRSPTLLSRKSDELSSLFVGFLLHQYFAMYVDDPASLELKGELARFLKEQMELQTHTHKEATSSASVVFVTAASAAKTSDLLTPARLSSAKAARGKLLAYLRIFAVGGIPRGGDGRALLLRIFVTFLSRPDNAVVVATLDCLINAKLPYLTPYATTCKALLKDIHLRDELVRFSLTKDIQSEHRAEFVPLLIRLLFGRFLAKASRARTRTSKDSPAARRTAIVSFMAGAQGETEFREFVHLMLRPFLVDATASFDTKNNLDVIAASAGRRLGFLHLLSSVIRQMGFHVLPFVGTFVEVTLRLLGEGYRDASAVHNAREGDEDGENEWHGVGGDDDDSRDGRDGGQERGDEDEENEVEDGDIQVRRGHTQGSLRLLSTRVISELFDQYAESFDFTSVAPRLWTVLGPSVSRLPAMCSGARQPPALLDLLLTLTQHDALLPIYIAFEATLTPTLLACLSSGQAPPATVAGPILSIMERLCEHDGASHLLSHLPALVKHITERLEKVHAATNNNDSLLERSLDLLCNISQLAARNRARAREEEGMVATPATVEDATLSSLFGFLLPRLKSPRLLRAPTKALVLGAYGALVPHMASPRRDVVQLSKLLGPAGLGPVGFEPTGPLRQPLVAALAAMADAHGDMQDLRPVMEMIHLLNAPDEEGLEGRNLDVVMPAWTRLAEPELWARLMAETGGSGLALLPLVTHALSCLHDGEVVVRVAAGASLRALVAAAGQGTEKEWLWLLQAGLLPSVRAGMDQAKDTVRQGYVQVMAALVRSAGTLRTRTPTRGEKRTEAPSWISAHALLFHGDLACLVRETDAEADFFQNIIHIQVHRRARALQRLTKLLKESDDETVKLEEAGLENTLILTPALSSSSLVHVLLPLASQPVLSVDRTIQVKAPDPTLLHESILATAAVARRLSWSHYNGLFRRFLREISLVDLTPVGQSPASRERALVNGLCHVLDVFHFPLTPPSSSADQDEKGSTDAVSTMADSEMGGAMQNGREDKGGGKAEDEAEGVRERSISNPPTDALKKDVIWRAVTTQLLPSLRGLLLKDSKDKEGGKQKVLRAPMALALLKLIKMLPRTSYEQELTRLFMSVCGTLRSRDSNVRDAAREVLAKMAQDLGPTYLGMIIKELKGALREGYMLHIRIFTLHTVLRSLEEVYKPPLDAPSLPVPRASLAAGPSPETSSYGNGSDSNAHALRPPLDACLTEIVALLTEDLFGEAAGAKEAEAEVKSATIKEAKGQKALDGLEILSRLLLFRPTYAVACPEDPGALSSVHALVKPFLLQLHDSESPRMHGRVNEALQRVVAGLSVNPSLKAEEVLLYVYGLISPFVLSEDEDEEESGGLDGQEPEAEASESEVDEEDDLQVIGKAAVKATEAPKPDLHRPKKEVPSWLPVDGTLKLAVEAKQVQRMAAREEIRVLDGKNAPKLTGWGRHGTKARRAEGGMFGSPAALAAGVLGLRLLHSYLKRLGQPSEELIPVLDPYVGLLARCVRRRVNDSIVLLSLKCLALMLRHLSSLPSLTFLTPRLVRSSLSLLSMAGGPANSRDEIVQSCLRILTILIAASGNSIEDDAPLGPLGLTQPEKRPSLPIPTKSLGALVCLLRAAALDYDHVNAPFALVRALVARRAMVPEMYDLMEQMLGIAVTSRRPTVRQMGGQIIVSFLLHYPLSSVKVAGFLQQAVRNLDYEYAEGRMAAFGLLQTLIMKLQVSMLNEHAQVVFFPMVLRLVNDPCPKTRAAAADAISALLRRVSGDVFNTLLDYQCRWMRMHVENEGLARAAAQAVGLFVDSRPDLFKRGGEDGLGMELLVLFSDTLASVEKRGPVPDVQADGLESPHEREGEAALGWEMAYHCLGTISRIYARLPGMVESFLHGFPEGMTLLSATSEILCYRHAWVRLAASRVIGQYLDRRATGGKTRTLITGTQLRSSPFLSDPAHCAALARRLCVQIDRPSVAPELSLRAVKSLVFLTSAMVHTELELEHGGGSPVRADAALEGEEEDVGGGESEVGVQEKGDAPKDLLSWIFHRLSYMARRKGEDRRCAVFQFFAAVTTLEGQAVVERFLPHMLSPLYRATSDGQAEASAHGNDAVELAKEVTSLIEEKAGATAFLKAFSDVQKQATQKRASRKQARAVEAITDPGAAAQRKLAKNVMKRETIKRKKGKYREIRGGAPPGERASKRQRSVGEGNKDEGM